MNEAISAKIIDKIRKLISLSENNTNTNESAAAFAQAQALLTKHRLSMAEVEAAGGALDGEEVIEGAQPLYEGERVIHWKSYLANNIAKHNGCRMFVRFFRSYDVDSMRHTKKARYVIVGRQSDIDIVNYLFNSIVAQIDILCKSAMARGLGTGKTFSNNFRYGASETVIGRIAEAVKQEEVAYQGSAALVLVRKKDEEVAKWMQRLGKLRNISSSSRGDASGRMAGREAGNKVSLNRGSRDK